MYNSVPNRGYLDEEKYNAGMPGRRLQIVGLTGSQSSKLNGKVGAYCGVSYEPTTRTHIKIPGDETIYKIRPRNLIPQGYTLKTIHAPYEVMTLAEQQEVDVLIGAAQKNPNKPKEWRLCFKYIEPQTNYCFSCHQFGTACYDYCAYCGGDYLRLLHVQKNKLMIFYKRCHSCMQRGTDLNLEGKCETCWVRQQNWSKPQ